MSNHQYEATLYSLNNRVALVAGAGSAPTGLSIGKATALLLAARGAQVVALDIDSALAQGTCDAILAAGGQAMAVQANVASEADMARAVQAAVAHFGGLDIYIANAGIGKLGGPMETSLEDLLRIQAVNVNSLLIGSRLMVPQLLARGGGAIVSLSSVAGLRYLGYPHLAYSVTKASVIHFTRMLAQQYAPQGIRANTVVPGLIDTPRIQRNVGKAYSAGEDPAEVRRRRDAQVPMGRMGTAQEVARAVAFLCSNEAAYITGTELVVDGGLSGTMRAGGQ